MEREISAMKELVTCMLIAGGILWWMAFIPIAYYADTVPMFLLLTLFVTLVVWGARMLWRAMRVRRALHRHLYMTARDKGSSYD